MRPLLTRRVTAASLSHLRGGTIDGFVAFSQEQE
jgi:hypothetical protein